MLQHFTAEAVLIAGVLAFGGETWKATVPVVFEALVQAVLLLVHLSSSILGKS